MREGPHMADVVDRWDAGDLALSILLTKRICWQAVIFEGKAGRQVSLVPTIEGDYWYVQLADGNAEELVFTRRPISPFGVGAWLGNQKFPLAANWEESDVYQPTEENPFAKGRQ